MSEAFNQHQIINKDAIIIGGGMIGSACALGLAQLGLEVLLVERSPVPEFQPDSPYDLRISAISVASVQLLKQLNAWQYIENTRLCPYRRLETWEIEGFATHFHAQELNLPELGFMLENNLIQAGLWQALKPFANAETLLGTKVQSLQKCGDFSQIFFDNGKAYQAPLIIGADGANSQIRQLAGIGITGWQYRQSCMLILVETELEQQDITWQQFLPTGPRAFLPLLENQACLVWYDSPAKIRELKQLSPEKLATQIEQAFPPRLGKVKVLNSGSFELTRRHAQQYVKQGVVLVGDSAHTINPLAGQGVNLGFKDVALLLKLIGEAQQKGQNWADEALLKRYERQRKADNLLMQTGMDIFYKGFKEQILPLKIARNLALLAVDKAPLLKKQALEYALGL